MKPFEIDQLTFDARGLIPCICQDALDGRILMLAWANREAIDRTLADAKATFWSRSREEIWQKGATSGNALTLVSIHADCDGDTLIYRVIPTGPACHRGTDTCFDDDPGPVLSALAGVIDQRATDRPEGSYTAHLLEQGPLKCAQKFGEEAVETSLALAAEDDDAVINEAADALYHLLVALRARDISWRQVLEALAQRAR